MDGLGRLVHVLAPSGSVDLHCRFAAPWAVENATAPPNELPYHVILDGRAWLEIDNQQLPIQGGDVLLFPYGAPHVLRSSAGSVLDASAPEAERRSFNGLVTLIERPGDGEVIDMLCGRFFLSGGAEALWLGLPSVLHVRTSERDPLLALIGLMRGETVAPRPGGQAVINVLSTALFTFILRGMATEERWQAGILGLLAEPHLAVVVDAVLKLPANDWTLPKLADIAHTSRASFIRHFVKASGLKPMEWVVGVRLAHAARLLRQGRLSAGRVAEQSGYASEAAFGRAFKARHGLTPGAYRRQHAES